MKYNLLILLLVLLGLSLVVYSDDCDSSEDAWDADCPEKQPFCRTTSVSAGASRTCVECRTDCDCDINKFCSQDVTGGNAGTCVKFEPAGDKCMPLSSSQHTEVDTDLKCSMTWDPPAPFPRSINKRGPCLEGKCRICNPSGADLECDGEHLGPARICVWPGTYETRHSNYWSPGLYFEEPIRVWCAVFFVFIVFICLANVCGCAHTTKKNYMK